MRLSTLGAARSLPDLIPVSSLIMGSLPMNSGVRTT